ncbi:MAG: DUF2490 domain-containing protein [Chitinophagaceae bacterium]
MKKIFLTIGLIYSCSFLTNAQSQFSGWLASFNTFKTGKKTSIHADIQWRSSDELKHTQTLLLRSGLNFHVSKKITTTAGYAFIHNRRVINGISGYAPEHRIWEQLVFSHKLKNIFVSHRFRLEQRFISKSSIINNELKNDGSFYASRFRYFIRNVLPLQKQEKFTRGFFAALQNEVFLNMGNTANVNRKIFDQNRAYLAIGYRVNKFVDLETGYLNQYIAGRNKVFTKNHVWQLACYLKL